MSPVVFAWNLYYAGHQELGPTSHWEVIWRTSIDNVDSHDLINFNPDTYGTSSNTLSDHKLMDLVASEGAKSLILIPYEGVGWRRDFVSASVLRQIRSRGVRVIAIWGDVQRSAQRRLMRSLSAGIDLHIVTASASTARRLSRSLNVLYSWVPVNDPIVSEPCDCGALVSFAGSVRPERAKYIEALLDAGIKVHTGGGEGQKSLSRLEFLRTLAHPISLSFQNAGGFEPVMNARPYEIARQGVLLMEQWGPETAKVFDHRREYVPWTTEKDLVASVRYYIEHEKERQVIAARAQSRAATFTDETLWNQAWEQSTAREPQFISAMPLLNAHSPADTRRQKPLHEMILESPRSEIPLSILDDLRQTYAKALRRTKISIRNPREVSEKWKRRRRWRRGDLPH